MFVERIIELLKQSPGAYLQLLFRQFEGWLKKDLAATKSVCQIQEVTAS
jgi:hypothetical protein